MQRLKPHPQHSPHPHPQHRPQRRRALIAAFVLLVLAVLMGGALGLWISRPAPQSLADFMSLSPLPPKPAPNLTLVDQRGQTISLKQFAGKSIVVEPMDTRCTDICPIISREFEIAYKALGKKANDVVFLGINVNTAYNSVADVQAFSRDNGLAKLASWHFLTGTTPQLVAAWKAYGVSVQINPKTGAVFHSDQMYFIGPKGHERYIATPFDTLLPNGNGVLSQASTARWGQGIAKYAGGLIR